MFYFSSILDTIDRIRIYINIYMNVSDQNNQPQIVIDRLLYKQSNDMFQEDNHKAIYLYPQSL